jgi:hypothetical protein
VSTRCNVLIRDEHSTIYIYRHSEGYPNHTGKDLLEFCKGYKSGTMRRDASQSAGWLILRGYAEYHPGNTALTPNRDDKMYGWKCGAYEPTNQIQGDVDYIYIIDLVSCELITIDGCDVSGKELERTNFNPQTKRGVK